MTSPQGSMRVPPDWAGKTLAAVVRAVAGESWAGAKRLVLARRVRINGAPCLDETRRLREGELVEVHARASPPVPRDGDVRVVYFDSDLIVVDKPAGTMSLRRGEERGWSDERKDRQPSLDELVGRKLPSLLGRAGPTRVRPVHRLDRDTSGLMLFAFSERAEHALIRLFSKHQIERNYLAVVYGQPTVRTVTTWLVRDRGDGVRGSTADVPSGTGAPVGAQKAITHVRRVEAVGESYSLVECGLETGRTHQIRIHLAEIGHMLCGEKVYTRPAVGALIVEDRSGAPRQALHSAEMKFVHPVTGKLMRFESPLPRDLTTWLERLRGKGGGRG